MRRVILAFVVLLLSCPVLAAEKWAALFRADAPSLWGKNSGTPSDQNGFALAADKFPAQFKYLRLTRADTSDSVIIPLTAERIQDQSTWVTEDIAWRPAGEKGGNTGKPCWLLGIGRKAWITGKKGENIVLMLDNPPRSGARGWGFTKPLGQSDNTQTYSWAGEKIDKTVFEIAVSNEDLTAEEKATLLTDAAAVASSARVDAPAKIARRQSSIHGLTVITDDTGLMLGSTVEVIMTAFPGKARADAPVKFVTPVGNEMTMVLDDVLRAARVRYPKWEADHIDLTFDDRVSKMNGGSIGAALGTLLLSGFEGYEIDPKLAMTGDVSADGKVRAIGGVVAKLRGATNAGCSIVAVPMDNYDQLADGLVYEGQGLFSHVQVIGIANLDDAAAVARTDRADKLKQAIEQFAQVQASLKKSPESLKSKATREKLTSIVDLAPNHYSAKLLLAAATDKAPRRLSATATLYYTAVAVRVALPFLGADGKAKSGKDISPAALHEGMRGLDKVRRMSDPSVIPLVDAWRELIKGIGDFQNNVISPQMLEQKGRAVDEAATHLNARRDVMEKMLREGV